MSRPLTISSAELLANEFSDGEIRLNCVKKTVHSAVYSAKMGPRVQIPLGPPFSHSGFGHLGESLEIYACARDLRLRMDPESGSGGADRGNTAKPIRARFCWVHGCSLTLRFIDRTEALSDRGGNFSRSIRAWVPPFR